METRVTISIRRIDIGSVTRFVSCKLKDHGFVTVLGRSEKERCALFVLDTLSKFDLGKKVVEKFGIVVLNSIFEALTLLDF